ncbi:MAG: crotonase [Burkholderiales bacterium RIFCSPLOWO2_12_67_14]|nr:MAG: crotonase [Burkholderiales bacterium RIFCSPLOWO2_02_FULL_67_64]OGB51131.1 MAG: crotonase [Burkholderiales bacterium RIFCSPLOWO2_12_67_14]OGB53198.1 MAG: crotonase [Burkholderiales bacterium RIFCSPHIGHO2_12_FULL_67_38]
MTLTSDRRDGVLTLTLNRPDKLNAINNDLSLRLLDALRSAAADPGVRVVRLRGNGRAFCAGRDVSEPPTERDLELVQAVAQAIVRLPQPVVADVHGWTLGAGLEWMLDADLVVAGRSARFRLPEASLGVFVTGGLTATLSAMVGLARARSLLLLGEVFDAQQALEWGLVYRVVNDPDREEASWRVATALAALELEVAQAFKRVLNQIGLPAFDRAIEAENGAQRLLGSKPGPT